MFNGTSVKEDDTSDVSTTVEYSLGEELLSYDVLTLSRFPSKWNTTRRRKISSERCRAFTNHWVLLSPWNTHCHKRGWIVTADAETFETSWSEDNDDDLARWSHKIVNPQVLREKVLTIPHAVHKRWDKMKRRPRDIQLWPVIAYDIKLEYTKDYKTPFQSHEVQSHLETSWIRGHIVGYD